MSKYRHCDLKSLKRIYEVLSDDLSKEIFDIRLQYELKENAEMFRPFLNQDMYKNIERIKFLIEKDSDISQIVIFGAGNIGKRYALMIEDEILLSKNHMVFCDNNEMLWGSIWQCGSGNEISIISPEQLKKEAAYSIVLVATNNTSFNDEISKQVQKMGISKQRILYHNPLESSINQYFDLQEMIAHDHEIFVDVGCLDALTSKAFCDWCGWQYKAIYAFEADKQSFEKCRVNAEKWGIKNMKIINAGLWDKNTKLSFVSMPESEKHMSKFDKNGADTVDVIRLDDYLDGAPVTFIKMDIEGAEHEALRGAEKTIRLYKPKLAISIYHKPFDFITIPKYILTVNNEYKIYFRHYSDNPAETVMYAI